MNRYFILAGIFIAIAAVAPAQLGKIANIEPGREPRQQTQHEPDMRAAVQQREAAAGDSLSGRSARIAAGRGGHYIANATMNGRTIEVMVDTGATLVAINESTARQLGIRLTPADFKYRVNTANGFTMAASTVIEEIRIGRVTVRDVPSLISRDSALSSSLLGMSFLGKLKKVSFENGDMVLVE
jgi:aspartyl protease family protein